MRKAPRLLSVPGWHRMIGPTVLLWMECPQLWARDANLGVHREAKPEQQGAAGRRPSGPEPLPWFSEDPRVVSAVVEFADSTAMKQVISRCPDQSDTEALHRAWDEEFGRAAEACPVGVTRVALAHLWSGCLAAAKAISPYNYWTGWTSPGARAALFRHSIFPECRVNPLYRAGALAARHFKAGRGEPYTLEGVPLRTCGDDSFLAWAG